MQAIAAQHAKLTPFMTREAAFVDPSSERLSKRVAAQLPCSRRDAELLIAQGAVSVDGAAATLPQQRVAPHQQVLIAPGARPQAQSPATLLVHKPAGLSCSDDAAFWGQLHRDASDALRGRAATPGMFMGQRCVAGLHMHESGLVVFTQVAGVLRRLLDDAPLVEHEFLVDVSGQVDPALLQQLRPARASINRQNPDRTGLRVVLNGPEPGQIEALCQAAGLRPQSTKRLRIGRLPLAGLEAGHWRCLGMGERF